MRKREFPEFFTTKGPIHTTVTPLYFGNNLYWMSSIANAKKESSQASYLRPYEDNDEGLLDCCDMDENYDIVLSKSGKFITSFYVPSSLLSFIIGAKGFKLKNLQKNTNTLIKVPKPNEKGNVKISGETERKVASARTQISMIIMQRKDKLPISHFVSVPLNSTSIKEKLKCFQSEILNDPPRGVTASLFQKPEKLHLTICTLTLVDEEELESAKKALNSCYEEVISYMLGKNKKYRIKLQGIEIMNDDPSEVNVLYGNVHMENSKEDEMLQDISDKIAEYFYRAGLARKQYDRVKLHVTLMNTSFRNVEEKKEKFDASNILKQYKDYYFGSAEFDNIQLSIRFTTSGEKYYESALVLEI